MTNQTRVEIFPIFKNYPNLVYLDSAATTQKPLSVINRIVKFYEEENANVHRGIYDLSEIATQKYEDSRNTVKKLFPKNYKIVFTSGTTDSANQLARTYLQNSIIISTNTEHHSNLLPFREYSSKQFIVNNIKNISIDYEKFAQVLAQFRRTDSKVALIITAVNNVTGEKFNFNWLAEQIANFTEKPIIVIDAAQWIGHEDIISEINNLQPDFIYFSGHKVLAPTGIGVTVIRKDIFNKVEPSNFGGGMIKNVDSESHSYATNEERLEAGTPNISGAIGLASAIDFLLKIGLDKIKKHEQELIEYTFQKFESELKPEGFKLIGLQLKDILNNSHGEDNWANKKGVFSFYHNEVHSHDIADMLNSEGIAIRAGHHCNQILHNEILKIPSSFRISFHIYNNKEDIDKFINELVKIKLKLKI